MASMADRADPNELLRTYLQGCSEPCPNCGYDLRGLDDTIERCPECGEMREVIIDREEDETLSATEDHGEKEE